MENLNAEQIKKALECCIDELKEATLALITSQEQRIAELTEENERLRADNIYGLSASNLAKKVEKLSYENERLRNRVVCKVVIPDEKLEEIKNECLASVELDIKAIQADTVRKIRKSLYEEFLKIARCQVADEPNMRSREVFLILDQITKEII